MQNSKFKITTKKSKILSFKMKFCSLRFAIFTSIFALCVLTFTLTSPTYAQIGLNPANQGNKGIKVPDVNHPEKTFGEVFNNILGIFFTVGGLGFIIYFVWGAVDWILSGGDKEKIAGARKKITTAITGLVVLSLTFVASIVLGQILGIQELRQLGAKIPKLTN